MEYLFFAIALFVYMSVWFGISLVRKRNDVADEAWGLGFVLLAWSAFFLGEPSKFALILNILVSIWGFRLAWHIFRRHKNRGEDSRYALWRKEWKWFMTRSFFQVVMLQGILLYLVALPILVIHTDSGECMTPFFFVGIFLWSVGFVFEVVGDKQLRNFLADTKNRGKIMTKGLWKYSRHPNYFGEVLLWWGIFLAVFAVTQSWIAIFGPITITLLILFVSGIPMAEKLFAGNPEFEEYKRKTSIFFPLPPKRD